MKRALTLFVAANAALLLFLHRLPAPPPFPQRTPDLPDRLRDRDRTAVRVAVEYDDVFLRAHDSDAEALIARAFAIVNLEWQRYRREWFRIEEMRLRPSDGEIDASHVLGTFMLRTAEMPDTIHVCITGRQLEVYSDGRGAMLVGGLAFRRSDALVVSAPAGVVDELLAYYLFHEIGHLWDAYDLPFSGGDSTYGNKSRSTFEVDIGNAQIIEEARGPQPRSTPALAPAIIGRSLAAARALTPDAETLARIRDLLLHEGSPSNPAYVRKRDAFLAVNGDERIAALLRDHEVTPAERRQESEARRRLAEHYWRAHEALRTGNAEEAADAVDAMLDVPEDHPNARMLLGAVKRKVKMRGR